MTHLDAASTELTELHETLDTLDDPNQLAQILAGIRDIKRQVSAVYDDCERLLLSRMDEKKLEVPGLGLVEAKRRIKRTQWDNDSLTKHVVALALDERLLDEATGEFEREADAVARVLGECARPSWRVTPLRARGLQIDEFCREEEDGWSVSLPSPSEHF